MAPVARVTKQTQHKILINSVILLSGPSECPVVPGGGTLKRSSFGLWWWGQWMVHFINLRNAINRPPPAASTTDTQARTHVQVSVSIERFDGGISISYSHIEMYWWALDTAGVCFVLYVCHTLVCPDHKCNCPLWTTSGNAGNDVYCI